VAGIRVPAGNFVYGIVSVEGERLSIHIPAIQYENNVLPVSLSVYYMDGLSGIYVPGSINRDVAKETADNSLQSIGIISMDQSLKGQATAAGISAAKSLLSKKVKQVNVTVKAGDRVLLKDDKDQSQ
jgi:conjugative transposon TraM protein